MLLQFLNLFQLGLQLGLQLGGLNLQSSSSLKNLVLSLLHLFQQLLTSDGLNTTHTGSNATLRHNTERTNLCSIVQMGTTTQFHRPVTHVNHTNSVAVLLAKQSGSTGCLSILDGHLTNIHIIAFQHRILHDQIDLAHFLCSNCGIVGKVKAQMVGFNQRTCLMHMITQHSGQCLLQQMGRRVGTHDGLSAIHVDGSNHNIIHLHGAGNHSTMVQILTCLVLLDICHFKAAITTENYAMVSNLTTHFCIERSLIQNNDAILTTSDGARNFFTNADSQHLCVAIILSITNKLSRSIIQTQIDASPSQITQCLTSFTSANLILFTLTEVLIHIHLHALVFYHFLSQVDGETVGSSQQECISTGENSLAFSLMLSHLGIEDLHAGVDGLCEVLFFDLDNLHNVVAALAQVAIVALIFTDNSFNHFKQEGLINTQQLAMTSSTAQQTAQNITTTFVAGQNAISDHESRCTNVIGDNTQAHIGLIALTVGSAGNAGNMVGDVHNRIHIEQAANALADNRQTLQTHAGVDILLCQLGVVALTVVIELGEHIVPHFHKTIAITARTAAGLTATKLLTTVVVDLRAGTARTGAMLPEVVLLAQSGHVILGNADHLSPNIPSLVIIFIHGGIHTLGFQADPLGAGQELPAPLQRLFLEVVTEREVTQHFKVSAVTCGLTDVFNITGTDTLLTGADSSAGRLDLTSKVGLHGSHTGVDQQQGFIVLRNQGEAGQTQMVLALKKLEEHLAQFIYAIRFMSHWELPPKNNTKI